MRAGERGQTRRFSIWKWSIIVLAFCCAVLLSFRQIEDLQYNPKLRRVDIGLRYHEIECAHTGINPYYIFKGDVRSEHYRSLDPTIDPKLKADGTPDNRPEVAAYPPWHVTYAWVYSWLPLEMCAMFLEALYLLIAVGVLIWTWRKAPKGSRVLGFAWCTMLCIAPAIRCFWVGNYGILILALSLAFYWTLEKKHDWLAGICWALMMSKPQLALLFAWPLLVQRRWRVITVATTLCVAATLWPAYVYQESPVALILQIPKMSVGVEGLIPTTLERMFGTMGPQIFMGLCFLLCGALCYHFRTASSWIVRMSPALVIFPIWTYSQMHDQVVLLPFLLMIAIVAQQQANGFRAMPLRGTMTIVVILMLFQGIWSFLYLHDYFDPTGFGWIYQLATLSMFGLFLCCTFLLFYSERKQNPRQDC